MNLIIDTCSWINLANEYLNNKYLQTLYAAIKKGEITLIVPEIIIEEWNAHKTEKVYNSRINSINTKIKHAREISKLLSEDKKYRFDDYVNEIQRLRPAIEEEAKRSIDLIDNLFTSKETIKLKISDDLKVTASDWAIKKLPPFGEKNSMKDALIFLSVIEYLKDKETQDNYFISDNFTDFASRTDQIAFSQQLKEYSDKVRLKLYVSITKFMNEIKGVEVDEKDKEIENIEFKEMIIRRLKSTEICHICGNKVTFSWLRSFVTPGLSLHILCSTCKYDIDTLEFWD